MSNFLRDNVYNDFNDPIEQIENIGESVDTLRKRVVANVVELKRENLHEGDYVKTLGYSTWDDGGGGEYYITNNANLVDNGGSVHILSNGLKAILLSPSNKVYSAQFGIKPNVNTDYTSAFQALFSYAVANNVEVLISAGKYIITSQLTISYDMGLQWVGDNNFFSIKGIGNVEFSSKVSSGSVLYIKTVNNGTQSRLVNFERIIIKPYAAEYRYLANGITLENTMGLMFTDVLVERMDSGLKLTSTENGYTEMNKFIRCQFNRNNFNVNFSGYSQRHSFHGNIFDRCGIVAGAGQHALSMQQGFIYNCSFDFNVFVSNTPLLYINADGNRNVGTIRYEYNETDGKQPKIKTGTYTDAFFFFEGDVVGIGADGFDWSEYTTKANGEERLVGCNTMRPAVMDNTKTFGKDGYKLKPLKAGIADSWKGHSVKHNISRYNANSDNEMGYIVSIPGDPADPSSASNRVLIGHTKSTDSIEKFIPGLELWANGSRIIGKNQTTLMFEDSALKRGTNTLYDSGTVKGTVAYTGNLHYPNGVKETWGTLSVAGNSTVPMRYDFAAGVFDEVYNVSIVFNSGSSSNTIKDIRITGLNTTGFNIYFDNTAAISGTLFIRVLGKKAYT